MAKHPLAEVFGFPTDNMGNDAKRYRRNRLCPYNNRVSNCTKDKIENPLGVCSISDGNDAVITCPVRFRQDWIIADDAASFFFANGTQWTSLTEVRLNNKHGRSAGNIDMVLVAYDDRGKVTDFGSLEVQAVYISGNVRRPFEHYSEAPGARADMDWSGKDGYPRPDYLSSSRKRLAPQLIYKGGIIHAWGKRMAVALNSGFFNTLPTMEQVPKEKADIAWLIYDLKHDRRRNVRRLTLAKAVYTQFKSSLEQITLPEPGPETDFVDVLQVKLDEKLENDESIGDGEGYSTVNDLV